MNGSGQRSDTALIPSTSEVVDALEYAECTLVITTLNEEQNIRRFLESVANQTVLPSEIIIVDAGSKDKTLDIVKETTSELSNLRVSIFNEPGTISHCRNYGIRRANHDSILSSDADCRLDSRFVELMVRYLEKYDVVGGTYDTVPGTWAEKVFTNRSRISWEGVHDLYVYPSMSVAFSRSAFETVGGYDESLEASEDFDICLRWRKKPEIRLYLAHDVKLEHFVGRDYLTLLRISFRGVDRDVARGFATWNTPYWKMYIAALLPPVILILWIAGSPWIVVAVTLGVAMYASLVFLNTIRHARNPGLALVSTGTDLVVRVLQVTGVYSGSVKRIFFSHRRNHAVRRKLG